ncbi:MAG: CHAD domain-containing protein [Ancalomicrobiaceae bacterium]|nr:CHAD domain-containing protein [Ancalomicrobiaceae bacterium]
METSTGFELRAMLVQELATARAECDAADGTNRSLAVHRARRALKRARSLFRVMKAAAGHTHRPWLRPVKEAFKLLSVARDADAMLTTAERLLRRSTGASAEVLAPTVAALADRARRTHAAELPIERIAELLQAAEADAATMPADFDAQALIAEELASAYKRGRTAFRAIETEADPDAWHAWRKAVKHRLHLTQLGTPAAKPHDVVADLDALAELLGECNDLANLAEVVQRDPALTGDGKTARRVLAVFAKRQRRLRQRARALGEALFRQRPRHFAHGLAAAGDPGGPDHAAA